MKSKYKHNTKVNFRLIILGSSCVILITLLGTLLFGLNANESKRGTFGDMFGFANSLFTGLSFVGLIITILLQRNDLQKQAEAAEIQYFDNTFFNLLNIHRSITVNFSLTVDRETKSNDYTYAHKVKKEGVNVFQLIYGELIYKLNLQGGFDQSVYNVVYKNNWEILGHYFRSVQLIITRIDQLNTDSYEVKRNYIEILKAQLSEYELAMIFYHFLSHADKSYKEIAEKYALFEYINSALVEDDIVYYNENAFVKN
ncbi:Putative phage abortive infection protein [Chryseobacterium rhizoplanae]|uniref:Phage abortive infection protein n=1 Tax=Chryseobacterium rhizoplanae TaxID=1609531 RepID=A0A521B765_9FLAO|nr:putative phage abortive infection protein [Chryseobacterium rhizoplanae]SMO42952.1 Putative phage abortive infection protein [Chryseobacterium rhizoplanae]